MLSRHTGYVFTLSWASYYQLMVFDSTETGVYDARVYNRGFLIDEQILILSNRILF